MCFIQYAKIIYLNSFSGKERDSPFDVSEDINSKLVLWYVNLFRSIVFHNDSQLILMQKQILIFMSKKKIVQGWRSLSPLYRCHSEYDQRTTHR